jgi:hypothetical protein
MARRLSTSFSDRFFDSSAYTRTSTDRHTFIRHIDAIVLGAFEKEMVY